MHDVTEAINPQFILPKGIYAVPFWEYPHDGYVPQELWRVVEPWMMEHGVREDTYYVSTYGRIYSCYTGKFMAPLRNNNTGYCHISLGEKNSIAIHRLVMIAFCWVSNYKELDVDHIDCNPSNNCIWNLQWCYHLENLDYMYQRNPNNNFQFQETGGRHISNDEAQRIMILAAKCKNPNEIESLANELGVTYRWLYDLRSGSKRPDVKWWYEQTHGPIPELEWKRGMGGVEKLDDETAYQMVKELSVCKSANEKKDVAEKYGISKVTADRYLSGRSRPELKRRLLNESSSENNASKNGLPIFRQDCSVEDARYIMTIIANCKNPREIEKRADEFGVTYRWLYDLRNGSIRPGIRQWYEQTYGPIPELEWKRGMGGVEKLDDETAYQMVKEMYGKPYKQKEEIAKKYGMSIITACRYLAGTARPHLKERLDRELGGGTY